MRNKIVTSVSAIALAVAAVGVFALVQGPALAFAQETDALVQNVSSLDDQLLDPGADFDEEDLGDESAGSDLVYEDSEIVFTAETSLADDERSAAQSSVEVDGTPTLYLPSYSDFEDVRLTYSVGAAEVPYVYLSSSEQGAPAKYASGASVDLIGLGAVQDDEGFYRVYFKSKVPLEWSLLRLAKSANVRTMYLLSDDPENYGESYVDGSADHSASATGHMVLVDSDGSAVYDGGLDQIRGRGNSTWQYSDKKPYQIKLSKKADLLETGDSGNRAKKWVLLAEYGDPTAMHNKISYELAKEMRLTESPECDYVDLYYDGVYRGLYLLSEKVEVGSGRVDMVDLEKLNEKANPGVDLDSLLAKSSTNKYGNRFTYVQGMDSPEDYSGGYLLELDNAYFGSERCWFATSYGYFVVKNSDNMSYEEMLYISEYLEEALQACRTNVDVEKYWDIDSVAISYLINDFIKNSDYGCSSTYVYLPEYSEGECKRFHVGPIWDCDGSFGIRAEGVARSTNGSVLLRYDQMSLFINNPVVQMRAKQIFQQEMSEAILKLLGEDAGSITELFNRIYNAQRMNVSVWGLNSLPTCLPAYATYEANVSHLSEWVAQRLIWYGHYVDSWSGSALADSGTRYQGFDYDDVFDPYYYAEHNADVVVALGSGPDALLAHFVRYGMSEQRQGSASFNVFNYKCRHADLQDAFGGDLVSYYRHYVSNGVRELRGVDGSDPRDDLAHAVVNGTTKWGGTDWNAVYDWRYYVTMFSDVAAAFLGDPIRTVAHFVQNGMSEQRQGSATFNAFNYKYRHADLQDAFGMDLVSYYRHYVTNGVYEQRDVDGSDPRRDLANAVVHGTSRWGGIDWSAVYDWRYYVTANTDVLSAFGGDPVETIAHFVRFGMSEQRRGSAEFDVSYYRASYDDLRAAFGSDFAAYYRHYIQHGRAEGRVAAAPAVPQSSSAARFAARVFESVRKSETLAVRPDVDNAA